MMTIPVRTILALAAMGSTLLAGGEPTRKPTSSDVTVKTVSISLPVDSDAASQMLWDTFANKPEESAFSSVTIGEWQKAYPDYARELIDHARKAGLEAEALEQILKDIDGERGSLALLPVGAYRATQGSEPVWIVVCKWEMDDLGDDFSLGHVRIYAYDIKTTRRVAFNTCM